ncbi:hypothetical protein D3C81_1848430 [compost metagenome]
MIAPKPAISTSKIPNSKAASTAQIAVNLAMSVCTGVLMPGRLRLWVLPYQAGIQWVNSRFITPTSSSGESASKGLGNFRSAAVSGSLRRSVP